MCESELLEEDHRSVIGSDIDRIDLRRGRSSEKEGKEENRASDLLTPTLLHNWHKRFNHLLYFTLLIPRLSCQPLLPDIIARDNCRLSSLNVSVSKKMKIA
ncbi:hypothetical protein L1987_67652 [Smallanthus sonchifolius]|uniref:Uncharacterized protein n=1 Tax=Smallanthus sonchifolius TaxID=185202 RepID=A0ACB9B3H8_9ASTR|nr:hypothetical protein L1987_67652 [Smallanthus sonchifolius]